MLRQDRNLVEKAFKEGLIKVLVCTSTLAWGVNLPAHAVIIRGTDVYDSAHGEFVDVSMLDVMQIFGRAGRFVRVLISALTQTAIRGHYLQTAIRYGWLCVHHYDA